MFQCLSAGPGRRPNLLVREPITRMPELGMCQLALRSSWNFNSKAFSTAKSVTLYKSVPSSKLVRFAPKKIDDYWKSSQSKDG